MNQSRAQLTIVFDVDGVIATGTKEEVYSDRAGWAYEKCRPIPPTIDLIRQLHEAGVRIVLHTARWESDREVTKKWMEDHEVPFDELVMGKPSADLYVDDKNFPVPYTPAGEDVVETMLAMANHNFKEKMTAPEE